ncbi:hypothetical protein THIX_60791 [Thiomonas sp. X19]|uniref:Uncharacterized protein n=1 Tax=mine drainage metagenome TaxID=410659 RepID=E6PKM3_9ZZZZ|nr:hypothetical protein THIX_60791 [Thiomonas sp. X19]
MRGPPRRLTGRHVRLRSQRARASTPRMPRYPARSGSATFWWPNWGPSDATSMGNPTASAICFQSGISRSRQSVGIWAGKRPCGALPTGANPCQTAAPTCFPFMTICRFHVLAFPGLCLEHSSSKPSLPSPIMPAMSVFAWATRHPFAPPSLCPSSGSARRGLTRAPLTATDTRLGVRCNTTPTGAKPASSISRHHWSLTHRLTRGATSMPTGFNQTGVLLSRKPPPRCDNGHHATPPPQPPGLHPGRHRRRDLPRQAGRLGRPARRHPERLAPGGQGAAGVPSSRCRALRPAASLLGAVCPATRFRCLSGYFHGSSTGKNDPEDAYLWQNSTIDMQFDPLQIPTPLLQIFDRPSSILRSRGAVSPSAPVPTP